MFGDFVQALELGPSAAVYEARANANIELERFMEAVQDASKAIELDSSNAKAYLRKG
jgi:Flp pilus assembly protein TadD